ncbi:RidA family protein [Mycobacterium sp. URHB0021]|jgi:enamine deaminase RidA (YjgF/YER057c/UK114 family)
MTDKTAAIPDPGAATFDDVVMLRVHLTKRDDFAAINDAYDAFAITAMA